jgi:HSP20 family protein
MDRSLMSLSRVGDLFDRMFGDAWREADANTNTLLAPALDVSEDHARFVVATELPGMERKDIDLQIKDGVLTIRGEKRHEEEVKDRKWHRVERRYGSFYRSLALPESVDPAKAEAAFKNGVLTVTLAKREETKPKTIAIKD